MIGHCVAATLGDAPHANKYAGISVHNGAGVMDKTFPARMRLLTGPEFARVLKAQTRVGDRRFVLYYLANSGGGARLGLAISKKIARTSVMRNRFKRIARESFRHHCHSLPGVDVVVMVRNGAL
ncbi:MAG: ribonuclease P protein component, partial [Pseudomonadota bacterium]